MRRWAIALVVAAASHGASAAPPHETARSFLQRVYDQYVERGPRSIEHLDQLYAPELAAEIRKDRALAGHEVGYLNGDPLCDCQDVSGMKPRIERLDDSKGKSAQATVVMDPGTSDSRSVTVQLVLTPAGWRVSDVSTREEPSLLDALRRSNASR